MSFDEIMIKAQENIDMMERVESESGIGKNSEAPLDVQVRTAMMALECSMRTGDWVTAGEALINLRHIDAHILTGAGQWS